MEKIVEPVLLSKKAVKPFKTYQVLIPVLLGLFVIGWLALRYRSLNQDFEPPPGCKAQK